MYIRVHRPARSALRHTLLACLTAASCAGFVPAAVLAQAGGQALQAVYELDIPAQPLNDALQALALQSKSKLLYAPELVQGRSAPALKGAHTVERALQRLLDGTGLSYEVAPDGLLLIRPSREQAAAGATNLDKVMVTADRDGLASQGYRSEIISQLGPLGSRSVLETPFSLNVIPAELVQNRIASSADDLFRINPVVQLSNPQSRFFSGATMRGFSLGGNNKVDGLSNTSPMGIDIEDKERIEVMTGLSGFLYGAGNVGGTTNYVLKRPTRERLTRFILNNNSGENFSLQADLGGPIDSEGRFRYRLNALGQDGDTSIDYRSVKRNLVSAALDWTTGPALWQFNASHSDYEMRGSEPYWSVPSTWTGDFPTAPDNNEYYGQAYTFTKTQQQHVGARVDWSISPSVFLRAALKRRKTEMDVAAANNDFVVGRPDEYANRGSQWEYPDNTDTNGYLFLDTSFASGVLEHRLTAGFFSDNNEQTNYRGGGWVESVENADPAQRYFSFASPRRDLPLPAPPSGPKYRASRTRVNNYLVGDEMRYGKWTALLGLTRTEINIDIFDESGARQTGYDAAETTPAVTLLYAANERLSIYGNYMESLEQGGEASDTYGTFPVVNAREVMPPLVSKQAEVGVKYSIGGMLLTTALFEIDRGLEYYNIDDPVRPVYVQSGRQVHRGIEFTASGKLTDALTLIGGFTLLDPEIARHAEYEGSVPQNVAKESIKLYAEYDLPWIPGLTLTGGAFHTGRQRFGMPNTGMIAGSTTVDVGGRIVLPLKDGKRLTLRMNVNNLSNKSYWMQTESLGPPRTILFSAQVDL